MTKGFSKIALPKNEPVLSYRKNSVERNSLLKEYALMKQSFVSVPMYIGVERIETESKLGIHPPHDHQSKIGEYSICEQKHIELAIKNLLETKSQWEALTWESRAAIFLKAADLAAGKYRNKLNAATMLCQSKTIYQAEIDSACELIDFLRFNVYYMTQIYASQSESSEGVWNRMEYRPLEGFTYAITPFNFTAIALNLTVSMALMGNVVLWKPSSTQIYSAKIIMDLLLEAGLPCGVINMVTGNSATITDCVLSHKEFAGVHFTGSTNVFNSFWKTIGQNIGIYNSYPRIVGETGGKDFILAHESANLDQLAVALVRGAFEYQGQKCSAASRAYLPTSIWEELKEKLGSMIKEIKIGSPEDPSNFMNAVIDKKAFEKISSYIQRAKDSQDAEIIFGGGCNNQKGYFIEPTIILAKTTTYESLVEEIFGPVLTIYLYDPKDWGEPIFKIIDQSTSYSLTGSVISQDRFAIEQASVALRNSAGNFYINDKPTGAVVSQQPFGGARKSGTNDKAGSYTNLLRWVSARSIKETFDPPIDFKYPFMEV